MTGPRKIIDLDLTPSADWKVDERASHLYRQKLWSYVTTGCVLCVESDRTDAQGQTLRSQEDDHAYVCLTHGELDEVPYTIQRSYTVKFGSLERVGTQEITDVVLIPAGMPEEERALLMERLLDVAAEEEDKQDFSGE